MLVVQYCVRESSGFRPEDHDVAGNVLDFGVKPRRVCGVREGPHRRECRPRVGEILVHGDGSKVVIVQPRPFQFRFRHVEAEGADQVEFTPGAGDEAYRVAGVLWNAGFEEQESEHPVHSATTFRGRMAQVDHEQFVGEDYADSDLGREHWTGRAYQSCTFRDADLSGLKTTSVVFTNCDFTGADLTESVHVDSAFRSCTFTRTNLQHSVFRHSTLIGSTFVDCRLRPATFDEVDFTLAGLGGADMRGMDLSGCRMVEANIVETDLRKATLTSVDLTGARTSGAKLDGANLRGARTDADFWVTVSLVGAKIEFVQAVAYARARGLSVEG